MYFLTGNIWLIVAMVLMLGETVIYGGSVRFFGIGGVFELLTYRKFIGFALGAAVVSFVLAMRSRTKNAVTK